MKETPIYDAVVAKLGEPKTGLPPKEEEEVEGSQDTVPVVERPHPGGVAGRSGTGFRQPGSRVQRPGK